MTIKKEFEVNNMFVSLSIGEHSGYSCVQGKVYPFLDRFHTCAFEAKITSSSPDEHQTSISLGGNSHYGVNADRMAIAITTANNLAKHYVGMMVDLQDANTAASAIIRTIGSGNLEQAIEYICLVPNSDMRLSPSSNHNHRASVVSSTLFDAIVRSNEFKSLLATLESQLDVSGDDVVSNECAFLSAMFSTARIKPVSSLVNGDVADMINVVKVIAENSDSSVVDFR
ncbi:hypothetical protein LMH73_004820 [Vibrio splendidus]|nr:hypothetical protein [Vibrio splendidus]MCC4882552.1 hypothetical protein [Vibrio splendidus]